MRLLVTDISNEVIENMKKVIGNNDIFVMSDSTPMKGFNVENVIIGVLSTAPTRPILIQCNITKESMTGEHISNIISNSLDKFFIDDANYHHRVRFFLSDQAKSMIKCGEFLKEKYKNMMHLSCVVHALHNVCVTIINSTFHIKPFVYLMNSILSNNIKHFSYFKEIFGKPIPTPVMTRFGSFLHVSYFYYENFLKLEPFLRKVLLNKKPADKAAYYISIEKLLINNFNNLYNELKDLYKYQFITNYINDLETKNIQLIKQIEIVEHVKVQLEGELKNRINSIITKSPDYQQLINLIKNEKLDNNNFKYLSLSTVDVERSFSILRKILNERTRKMSEESINNYMIIRYNKLVEYVKSE